MPSYAPCPEAAGGSAQIGAELRAAWNERLYYWWHYYNQEYAGGALKAPTIHLGQSWSRLGHWERHSRRLVISVHHIERDPWVAVLATLRHEMAHQYAHEVLRAEAESAHGDAFAHACHRLRCETGSTVTGRGYAEAGREDASPQERILERLQKVLSLAASTTEHEAAAAVKQARRMLLRYNITAAQRVRNRVYEHRHLGKVKARRASYEHWLAQILREFFFTEVIWVESYDAPRNQVGTVLRICGSRQNVDLAQHAYEYLTVLIERLWSGYRRQRGLPGNRERQRYYAGVLEGFCMHLREQERRIQTEGLVWLGDGQLAEYHRYLHPRVRKRRGPGVRVTSAYRDGLEDGRHVIIHPPLTATSRGFGGYLTSA